MAKSRHWKERILFRIMLTDGTVVEALPKQWIEAKTCPHLKKGVYRLMEKNSSGFQYRLKSWDAKQVIGEWSQRPEHLFQNIEAV